MATYYVRKNGSGTHTTIQSAIYDAVSGDIVDIGPGTFEENVDLYKGITLRGAGKESTIVVGSIKNSVVVQGTWAINSTTLNFPSGTTGFEKGRIISGTGIPANARIASVSSNSVVISAPTTSARSVLTNATMVQNIDATIRVRGSGAIIHGIKFVGYDHSNPATEYAAVYFRNTGLGTNFAQNFEMYDCHLEANGEYAILSDSGSSVGNGTVRDCLITGKTFVGSNPASGNQFSVWNVPRQLVAFQSVNLPITFKDNIIQGTTGGLTTGGVASFNTAVTIDAANSVVTGNFIDGTHGYGYALRVRGAGSVVSNNINKAPTSRQNSGFMVGPTGSQLTGLNIGSNSTQSQLMVNPSQELAGSPIKNTIDKNEIKMLPKVASDSSFSDENNWKLVVCVYKLKNGTKRFVSAFRDFSSEKQSNLKPNMISGEEYQLHKLIISKEDRSMLVLKRSEISDASSYDFILK
jgi:hypothetical protein